MQISENFLQRICYIDGRSLISFLVHFLSKLYFAIKHSTTSPVANTEKVVVRLVDSTLTSLYIILLFYYCIFSGTQ